MSDFTVLPIPYVPLADKAAEVRLAIDAARLSAANSFGGLQKLAIPGPFATDAEANTFGVPDDNLYYRSDGTVRAASHISLDLAFALDKTLTARTGPTPTFTRASGATYVGSDGLIHGIDTSTTSVTFGTGSKTVTLSAPLGQDQMWRVGNEVEIVNSAGALMSGTVTSYTASTQELVCNITSSTGTGTFTTWRIGYRGARFDHDATGVCKGLLIEESRTNLVFPSETLTTQTRTVTAVAHSLSFYGTGTVVLSGVHSATVVGTGVFPARTTLTFTPTAGSLTLTVTGTVQFAQLEAGAFPTSYIPTTIGTAARSADVCSIIGADFSSFYNQSEGTLFARTQKISTNTNAFIAVANNGTFDNSIDIRYQSITSLQSIINSVASPQASFTQAISSGTDTLQAVAYKPNDAAYCAIGLTPVLDASVSVPTTNRLGIGQSLVTGSPLYLNGHIARIQYFRKRLSNAKLQTLTAP